MRVLASTAQWRWTKSGSVRKVGFLSGDHFSVRGTRARLSFYHKFQAKSIKFAFARTLINKSVGRLKLPSDPLFTLQIEIQLVGWALCIFKLLH